MKSIISSLLLCFWLLLAVHGWAGGPNEPALPLFEISSGHCAYYSAYLAAKYNKLSIRGLEESSLSKTDDAVSMSSLATELTTLGLHALSVQCDWSDLKKYPSGFILVLKAPQQSPSLPFHYCFGFYQQTREQFYFADPVLQTSVAKMDETVLKPFWTGYAILLSQRDYRHN